MPDSQNPQAPPIESNNEKPNLPPTPPTPSVPPAPVQLAPAPASAPSPVMVPASQSGSSGQNNSGMGSSSPVPLGIDGWGWGPFFLTWIWGVFNSVWISLLVFVPVPFIGIIMAIVLGTSGRKWAWQSKKWKSVEHFNEVQRKWSIAGFVVSALFLLIGLIILVLVVVAAINPAERVNQGSNNDANSKVSAVGSAVSACIDDQTSKGTQKNVIYSDTKLDLSTKKGGCASADNLISEGYVSSVSFRVEIKTGTEKICVYMEAGGSPPSYASYDSSEGVVATAPNGTADCS